MDDIENAIDSVWDQDIDLDEWDNTMNNEVVALTPKMNAIVKCKSNTTTKLRNELSSTAGYIYKLGSTLMGSNRLDRMLTSALNSCSDDLNEIVGDTRKSVYMVKDGTVYGLNTGRYDTGKEGEVEVQELIEYTIGSKLTYDSDNDSR